MPYTVIDKGSKYFNTKLYTGNGTAIGSGGQVITGIGFKPDWVWIKARSTTHSHRVFDAVRGVQLGLQTNSTVADLSMTEGLNSFNADGYTYGSHDSGNELNTTYVAWNWLGANTTVSNTAGTISSTVSANTTSGFSIVSYTGTGSVGTVGHGLGVAPKMIILKNRDRSIYWNVYHASLGKDYFLKLNTTDSAISSANIWGTTAPTSTVFDGAGNDASNGIYSGDKIIAYCFAEIKGYSKFGSYVGNGNANGTFTYTGFRPSFFLIKNTTTAGNGWHIFDNKRIGFNTSNYQLSPSDSGAEDTTTGYTDILSNGFKMRSTNDFNNKNGNTYIYMAFAENPFVSSKGIPTTAR
jgi:hypothetical protein